MSTPNKSGANAAHDFTPVDSLPESDSEDCVPLPGRPRLVAILDNGKNGEICRRLLVQLLSLKDPRKSVGAWSFTPHTFNNEAELRLYQAKNELTNGEIVLVVVAPSIRRCSRQFGWGTKEFQEDTDWARLEQPEWVRLMPHVVVINRLHKPDKIDFRSLAATIRSTFFTEEFDRRLDDDSQEIYGPLATSENPISGLTLTESFWLRERARQEHARMERGTVPIKSVRDILYSLARKFRRGQIHRPS